MLFDLLDHQRQLPAAACWYAQQRSSNWRAWGVILNHSLQISFQ
jgi:hypothetical protein